jgi:hypothetical protein
MSASPVSIRSTEALAVGTVVWSDRGQLRVTAIAKATFTLLPSSVAAAMPLAKPLPLESSETHHDDNPGRSVRSVSDLAPQLTTVDVTLRGHARAPRGQPTSELVARLAIFRDGAALFDKRLRVVGDRVGDGVKPFEAMPLTYERTFGGIGCQDNPLGVGFGSSRQQPNLLDLRAADRVACFAPISRSWPARKLLLRNEQRKALDRPIPEIPEGLDWGYYQCAPLDQRLARLTGGEELRLEGMSADAPLLVCKLPLFDAKASFWGLLLDPREAHVVPLVADTLAIDVDAGQCSVTFRASVPVASEGALAAIRAAAALGLNGAAPEWPPPPAESASPRATPAAWPAPLDAEEEHYARTVALAGGFLPPPPISREATIAHDVARPKRKTMPFSLHARREAESPSAPAPLPGAPWGPPIAPPAQARPVSAKQNRTATLHADDLRPPPSPAAPETPPPVPPPPAFVAPKAPVLAEPSAPQPPAPVAAPPAPVAPPRDPYGQAVPWASGPRNEAPAETPPTAPTPEPERPALNLYKKFSGR